MIRELRDIEREMGRNEVAQFRGRGFDAEIVQAQQSPALALRLLRIRVCVQGKADVLRHACLHVRHGVRHRVQVGHRLVGQLNRKIVLDQHDQVADLELIVVVAFELQLTEPFVPRPPKVQSPDP